MIETKTQSIQKDLIINDDYLSLLGSKTNLKLKNYKEDFIQKRIQSRMKSLNLRHLKNYYNYLNEHKEEIDLFKAEFSINFTSFFRNPSIYHKLQEFILKSLKNSHNHIKIPIFKRDNKNSHLDYNNINIDVDILRRTSIYSKIQSKNRFENQIKIWSCPCATGEEPFSISILLCNLKNQIKKFPFYKIYASDISHDAILTALIGKYTKNALNDISESFQHNCFYKAKYENNENYYIIKNHIRKYVEFFQEDIFDGHIKNEKYDIIFFRNLFIYLKKNSIRQRLIKIIENVSNFGALLFLGKTENLDNVSTSFRLIDPIDKIYIKE